MLCLEAGNEEEAKGLDKLKHDYSVLLLCNFFIHWVMQVNEKRHQAEWGQRL